MSSDPVHPECFVSVDTGDRKPVKEAVAAQGSSEAATVLEAADKEGQQHEGSQLPLLHPITLVAAADMYANEPKPATAAGGFFTVLALLAALAYTTYQVVDYTHMPNVVTSYVQWSDTQGPFPAVIRCTAPGGCWVSNRHNDRWSSHGDQVEDKQQGCMQLHFGQEYTMNITFTQNTLNGLVILWDPLNWESGQTPGSGFQVMAETNYPAAASGVFVLPTPVLGGTYLASYVETHNHSAPAAKLRREGFITYVSADKAVMPAATACSDILTAGQLSNLTQATIRMQSAWYLVTVEPPNLLLTLLGNCGGALQLCLQAGAILLLTFEFLKHTAPKWTRVFLQFASSTRQTGSNGTTPRANDAQHRPPGPLECYQLNAAGATGFALAPVNVLEAASGNHFALHSHGTAARGLGQGGLTQGPTHCSRLACNNAKGAWHGGDLVLLSSASSATGTDARFHFAENALACVSNQAGVNSRSMNVLSKVGRGLASMSYSGDGSAVSMLHGLSIGGHLGANAGAAARQLPGLVLSGDGSVLMLRAAGQHM